MEFSMADALASFRVKVKVTRTRIPLLLQSITPDGTEVFRQAHVLDPNPIDEVFRMPFCRLYPLSENHSVVWTYLD